MVQLDVLTPVDYDLSFFPPNVHNAFNDQDQIDVHFQDLPPLHVGHPDHLMNQNILRATSAGMRGDADAERAFFVADLGAIYRQHVRWQNALPNVEPFYAVKCNPDRFVLRAMKALGVGFDCASLGEIAQVMSLGVTPDRIIFANPCKPTSFIQAADRAGVSVMTFDNSDELKKLSRTFPQARLVLRILTDDSYSTCRLGLKFGATLTSVPRLLQTARSLGLSVIGVSFHVGSGCKNALAFRDAVRRAHTAFSMGRSAGFNFDLLDVGGGFEDAGFEQSASVLRDALEEFFPSHTGVRVIAEPGRYYVANAFTLATNVIARRTYNDDLDEEQDDQPRIMYYINHGVYGSFNCIQFDHQVMHPHVLTLGGSFVSTAAETSGLALSSVWGPTCDSIDCVAPLVRLPMALEVGDWLGFRGMGAYTLCAASTFNGFKTSSIVYTSGVGADGAAVRRALAIRG